MTKKPYTTGQISKICKVDKKTVSKWIKEGRLKAYQLPSGDNRIQHDKLLDFLKTYNFPIPEELAEPVTKKLLIVDDDKRMVSSLHRLFYNDNYQIETAYDGFEAGFKIVSFKPNVIILDLKMPGIDGITIAEKIKKDLKNENIKIIVLSAFLTNSSVNRLQELNVEAILEKPFNEFEIKEKVMHLFQ